MHDAPPFDAYVRAPVRSRSLPAAVTWSACTWVSSTPSSRSPSSPITRRSRSICSSTGSISAAAPAARSASRYVYVELSLSKSWRSSITPTLYSPAMDTETALRALVGGALIGGAASLLLLAHGRIAGISGILGALLRRDTQDRDWRIAFLIGLVVAGVIAAVAFPSAVGGSPV